ncbi:hypothetical protein JDN40_02350 [Rhodomicrobium vannielii ATCC 17100]|uniref:hypothetical protein n=1 Tax=Rhodomicrobium vannielii TaxID=1069 RepID=UPI001917E5FD|nr:hypothetical protein [Rhodomicrobium vannielii]MBJ7532956.1 hypothetical protein [Rhodomicrobium vannielii ATCC 17100]
MSEPTNTLLYEILKSLQAGQADIRSELASQGERLNTVSRHLGLLSDGVLSLRKDVQMLVLSVGGHAERLADLEVRLERIESRLPPASA